VDDTGSPQLPDGPQSACDFHQVPDQGSRSQFTDSFDAVFTADGIRILASPPQAPRANAICERIIGTLRRELFDRLLIVNEHHLHRVLTEYLRHYNTARPHRALGQLAPAQASARPPEPVNLAGHRIRRRQILGGLTHEYQIAARQAHVAAGGRRSPPRSYIRAPHVDERIVADHLVGRGRLAAPWLAATPPAPSSSEPAVAQAAISFLIGSSRPFGPDRQ
jgi:hypothetical protein